MARLPLASCATTGGNPEVSHYNMMLVPHYFFAGIVAARSFLRWFSPPGGP